MSAAEEVGGRMEESVGSRGGGGGGLDAQIEQLMECRPLSEPEVSAATPRLPLWCRIRPMGFSFSAEAAARVISVLRFGFGRSQAESRNYCGGRRRRNKWRSNGRIGGIWDTSM